MTATQRVFDLDDLSSWRKWYARLEEPGPYHHPDYVGFVAGWLEHEHSARLFVLEDGDDLVYYPFMVRSLDTVPFAPDADLDLSTYADIVSSWYYGGPVATGPGAVELADRFVKRFGDYCADHDIVAEFVRFDPYVGNHEHFGGLEPEYERETVWVDLAQSEAALWDGFEKRNRNAIRQAQDTDLVVEPTSDIDDVAAFHRIYRNAMEAKGAAEHYRFDQEFFAELLANEELASLLVARYEDDVVGGSVIVHDDSIAHDYLRASNPDYWDMRVNNLICYEALMYARATGRDQFDFQGGRPGVFKFKKSFSPKRATFHVAKRVHMPETYNRLVGAAERAGIDTDTDYFPKYRVEQSN